MSGMWNHGIRLTVARSERTGSGLSCATIATDSTRSLPRKQNRMNRALDLLMDWYAAHCNGDWEHSCGVTIGTLDNPGWSVDIDLEETALEERRFAEVRESRKEDDWIRCWVDANMFKGRGGPRNLEEILTIFTCWSGKNSEGRL